MNNVQLTTRTKEGVGERDRHSETERRGNGGKKILGYICQAAGASFLFLCVCVHTVLPTV